MLEKEFTLSIRYHCKDSQPCVVRRQYHCTFHPTPQIAEDSPITLPHRIMSSPLPQTDSHVELTLLAGGSFTATANFLHAGAAATPFTMFNWAFHISHPSGRQIVWDVGNTSVRSSLGWPAISKPPY